MRSWCRVFKLPGVKARTLGIVAFVFFETSDFSLAQRVKENGGDICGPTHVAEISLQVWRL
jgi:hypothetical protein